MRALSPVSSSPQDALAAAAEETAAEASKGDKQATLAANPLVGRDPNSDSTDPAAQSDSRREHHQKDTFAGGPAPQQTGPLPPADATAPQLSAAVAAQTPTAPGLNPPSRVTSESTSATTRGQTAAIAQAPPSPPPHSPGFHTAPAVGRAVSAPITDAPVAFVVDIKPTEASAQSGKDAAAIDLSKGPVEAAAPETGRDVATKDAVLRRADTSTSRVQADVFGSGLSVHADSDETTADHGFDGQQRREDEKTGGPDRRIQSEPIADSTSDRPTPEPALRPDGSTSVDSAALRSNPRIDTPTHRAERPIDAGEAVRQIASTPPPEAPKTGRVHEISLPAGSGDGGAVKVHVVERGGDIRISVRSADADLTHSMRRDLGDLVTKLEDRGFEAKAWHPHEQAGLAVHGMDSRDMQVRMDSNPGGGWNSDSQERGGNSGSGQQQHQEHRHGDPRRWMQELDETVGPDGSRELEDEWR